METEVYCLYCNPESNFPVDDADRLCSECSEIFWEGYWESEKDSGESLGISLTQEEIDEIPF